MCNNETDLKSIGERIKKARKKLNMAQDELAKELHCKRELISYYENGSREIKTGTLIELSKILGVSADYLLGLSIAETKNVEISGICDYTGLSEKALEMLHRNGRPETLNSVLENLNFWALIGRIEKYREFAKDAYPIELYLNEGKYAENSENSSITSIANRDLALFQIQELIKEIAKDGANNGNDK